MIVGTLFVFCVCEMEIQSGMLEKESGESQPSNIGSPRSARGQSPDGRALRDRLKIPSKSAKSHTLATVCGRPTQTGESTVGRYRWEVPSY